MFDLDKLLKYLFHPASVILLIIALAVGTSMAQIVKEERVEVAKAKVLNSVEERLHLTVECVSGIEYWRHLSTNNALMLTPKWSQGKGSPDTCETK